VSGVPSSQPAEKLEASKIIGDYIATRLEQYEKYRDRLETQTSLITTSSGGLVAVVGVVAALLPKPEEPFRFRTALLVLLVVAVALLLTAAAVGQVSSLKLTRRAGRDPDWERAETTYLRFAGEAAHDPLRSLAVMREHHIDAIRAARYECAHRLRWLRRAGMLQMLGVFGLGSSLIIFVSGTLFPIR
jgi:hypothetical protein